MTDAEFVEPTTPEQMLLTAVTPRLEAMSDDEIAASSTATERIMEERAPTSLLRQQLADAEARIQTLRDAIARDEDDICQTLGKVLGYPWYKDDQKNFPGATEADGVCVGEHVAASIAAEAARRVRELEEALENVRQYGRLADHSHWDAQGNAGRTCPVCVEQVSVRERVRAVLARRTP